MAHYLVYRSITILDDDDSLDCKFCDTTLSKCDMEGMWVERQVNKIHTGQFTKFDSGGNKREHNLTTQCVTFLKFHPCQSSLVRKVGNSLFSIVLLSLRWTLVMTGQAISSFIDALSPRYQCLIRSFFRGRISNRKWWTSHKHQIYFPLFSAVFFAGKNNKHEREQRGEIRWKKNTRLVK